MATIHDIKEREIVDTPLFLFECRLTDGTIERWSTHSVVIDGLQYDDRVRDHNAVDLRFSSDDGSESNNRVYVRLWNVDGYVSQVQRTRGWKGAKLKVSFVFFDLLANSPSSEVKTIFRGVGNPPEEVSETEGRVSFSDRLSHQRVILPDARIQRRCGWRFPKTPDERTAGISGGTEGKHSSFYRCGYSAGEPDGVGNLNGSVPFTFCDGTRDQCRERGMFDKDSQQHPTARFGGFGFVPASTLVRSSGEKGRHDARVAVNEALYDDPVPLVYGTVWVAPATTFSRNDGNLTRMESVISLGETEAIIKVLVNGYEIPAGVDGFDMTATGWYNPVSTGSRSGSPNRELTDGAGSPIGDPHGSISVIAISVPNRVATGNGIPRVQALIKGLRLERFDSNGSSMGEEFTNNPCWVLLDLLRRCGWDLQDLDLTSFSRAASFCEELVETTDLSGSPTLIPRYQCNLALSRRRSAAEIIRGVRSASQIAFAYGEDGRLGVRMEGTVSQESPIKPVGSNSQESLNGGWPAYEFSDGTADFSGLLRRANGESSVRFFSRSNAETINRASVEFQNEFNEYQQDSLSLVDREDAYISRQETSVNSPALGIANFDQALRALSLQIRKSSLGNSFVDFETSVRGIGLRPGDLIALTYSKENMIRQAFRIVRVEPASNFATCRIVAQIHDDDWYTTVLSDGTGERRELGSSTGVPRPLLGDELVDGELTLSIEERIVPRVENSSIVVLTVGFVTPSKPSNSNAEVPIVDLAAVVSTSGGSLKGSSVYYYQICGADADGIEGRPSFTINAPIHATTNLNAVRLTGLRFGPQTSSFNVYRGSNPLQLYRIATGVVLDSEFLDDGSASPVGAAPPDQDFSHANIYWRFERIPELQVMSSTATSVTNTQTPLLAGEHEGAVLRITTGKGSGQERRVVSNTATTIVVNPAWRVIPDSTSKYVIADPGWNLGSVTDSSPAVFEVPNRTYAGIHVLARAASVREVEAPIELSPIRRWTLGSSGGATDFDVPPIPQFSLATDGDGAVELSGLGFQTLQNTRSIHAGALWLWYWDERDGVPFVLTTSELTEESTDLSLSESVSVLPGQLLQVEREIVRVDEVISPSVVKVTRHVSNSAPFAHPAGSVVSPLKHEVQTIGFPRGFFGSPASGSYAWRVEIPCVRVAAADLVMTNAFGNGLTRNISFGSTGDRGLRTLRGGQITLEVDGFIAIEEDAASPFIVDSYYSIRDLRATIGEPANGGEIQLAVRRNGEILALLIIQNGETSSNIVDGLPLGILAPGDRVRLDVVSVPAAWNGLPGKDLSVSITT